MEEKSKPPHAKPVYRVPAACRGCAKFKSSDETFDESFRAEEFIAEVHGAPKTLISPNSGVYWR